MADNATIARILRQVADLLEIQGANSFRVRAYRNAVRTIEDQTVPLADFADQGRDLTSLPGIGREMARHVEEIVESGRLAYFDELAAEVPPSLIELVRLPGVGAKKAHRLWQELGIESIDDLEAAAAEGRVAGLSGFGAKTEQKILAGIEAYRRHASRLRLVEADRRVAPLLEHLAAAPGVRRVEAAGSLRRRKETVGDVDLLAAIPDDAAADAGRRVVEHFVGSAQVERVEMAGDTRASVVLSSGLEVDLRVVPEAAFGAALVYFTGSKEHNVELRQRALGRGARLSEYGLFALPEEEPDDEADAATEPAALERLAGATEEEVYEALGLAWVAPELREGRGEVAAAAAGELPDLIELGDLRGDLQMHSTWSDGRHSIEEMLEACVARGYEYFALTDHSQSLAMTGGLDEVRLAEQWREIDEIAARHPEIRFLKSQEIDILADGSLDTADEMIAGLDWVLVSIHSRFGLPPEEQTERILKAIAHPRVHAFAHPTGRVINRRPGYRYDLDRVLAACADHNVAMELNASPARLDLSDVHLMRARELGVKIVISTDAHRTEELDFMHYGVEQARRAGLEPSNVLNTLPLDDFLTAIAK